VNLHHQDGVFRMVNLPDPERWQRPSLSADPENAYFSVGITEDILTKLAGIADLRVVSSTSVEDTDVLWPAPGDTPAPAGSQMPTNSRP
jgi:hypothetical protein